MILRDLNAGVGQMKNNKITVIYGDNNVNDNGIMLYIWFTEFESYLSTKRYIHIFVYITMDTNNPLFKIYYRLRNSEANEFTNYECTTI